MESLESALQHVLHAIISLIDRTDELSTRDDLMRLLSQAEYGLQTIWRVKAKGKVVEDESLRMALLKARESLNAALIHPNNAGVAIEDVDRTLSMLSPTLSRLADTSGPSSATPARKETVTEYFRTPSRKRSVDFGPDTDIARLDVPVTGRKRGVRGGTATKKPKSQVECQFRAEMDSEVVVNKRVSVDVTIARHAVGVTPGRTGDAAKANVDVGKTLIVQIAERRNFRVDGERRVEIGVPRPDEDATVSFDVTGVIVGEGELWVQVRQGPVPLVTLKLKPCIVAKAKRGPTERLPVEQNLAAIPPVQPALDRLTIQESLVGNDVQYHYVLELPTLGILKYFKSPVIEGRDQYIVTLLNNIGDAWAGTAKDQVAAFETDLKSIGATMFTRLLPREMQEVLWELRGSIKSVQVFSMEPFIPWELLYFKDPRAAVISDKGNFLGELGVVRWFYENYPPLQVTLRDGRARYVIPTYKGKMALPMAREEALMVQKIFNATPVAARAADVQRLVRTPGSFDLLHFAGHAEAASVDQADARLLLDELNDGSTENVLKATTVEQTARLVDDGHHPIVVLNACESGRGNRGFAGIGGFASAFVKGGAGVFIGTHWSVGEGPSRTFIEAFYKILAAPDANGKGVRLLDAVSKARKAARKKGDATWLAYVVYGHPMAMLVRSTSGND